MQTFNPTDPPPLYGADWFRKEFQALRRQLRVSAVDRILGRATSEGAIEEITCTAAGRALLDDASASAQRTTLGLGTVATFDYAQGPWTPGVSFGGGTTGITYTTQVGTYGKIGNTVICSGYILLSSKGSSTGAAKITGLPFTVSATAGRYSAAALRTGSITFANQFQGYADINTTTIVLDEVTEAGARTSLTDADFGNTSDIMVNVTYHSA